MEQIQFAVSAKTARLIGRENISDVDGAIVELIKNSYDADADAVFVFFNIPFPSVPKEISFELANKVFADSVSCLLKYYSNMGESLVKKEKLNAEDEDGLAKLLFKQNQIIIMDNGHGMDEEILRTSWMNIGTNDKEERRISPKGRIKTGAKGIGRFALDKLSTKTVVYTKNKADSLKMWQIDWEQFDSAEMLNEVSASIDDCEGAFQDYVNRFSEGRFGVLDEYNWDSGTIICLNPTRETWSTEYFQKVNRNLKSIFPFTNTSKYDIYVTNVFYPELSFNNERFSLEKDEYDYKIEAKFDGIDNVHVEMQRNEIDVRRMKAAHTVKDIEQSIELIFSNFWKREAFTKKDHKKSDYAKTVCIDFSASGQTELNKALIGSIGSFKAELYFLKNAPSHYEIVKPISSDKRKKVLKNYSGIKLYRDGFKVRPYGDEGTSEFDWLQLGLRAQRSPAAVSHPNGSWRVRSNQIIGSVHIRKDSNPNLFDMANREGLAVNDTYRAFVIILQKVLEIFEADRQYIFKEYASWIKEKERAVSKTTEIVQSSIKESEDEDNQTSDSSISTSDDKHNSQNEYAYSKAEYQKAVADLEKERQRREKAMETMMLYSSSGVMTNTFSHEISKLMTDFGSRTQQFRAVIKRLLGEEGYKGNPIFDPFLLMEKSEKVDTLLENWLGVMMNGTGDKAFSKKKINPIQCIQKILDNWNQLLKEKSITVQNVKYEGDLSHYSCSFSEIEMIIVMNNFLLNSAWFLEKMIGVERIISVTVKQEENVTVILLENNGPPLDDKFANNPDCIFEAGVSAKILGDGSKGSGIGLWMVHTLVYDNSGEIHPIEKDDGFGLRMTLPK